MKKNQIIVKYRKLFAISYLILFLLIMFFVLMYRGRINPFSYITLPFTQPTLTLDDFENLFMFNGNINVPTRQNRFYHNPAEFSARITTDVFTITFTNGNSGYFVGATIQGNVNMFMLEVRDTLDIKTLRRDDIVRVRATYVGAILGRRATRENRRNAGGEEEVATQNIYTITLDLPYFQLNYASFMHMQVDNIKLVTPDIIDNSENSYTSSCFRRYKITFFNAYMSAITTRQRTTSGYRYERNNVLLIDYDVPSGAGGVYNNLFRTDFVVYDSFGNLLGYWERFGFVEDEDFIRVDDRAVPQIIFSHRGRYHLSTWVQFGRDEIINAVMVVVPVNIPQYIRIVRYDLNFQMIYNHKIYVQR